MYAIIEEKAIKIDTSKRVEEFILTMVCKKNKIIKSIIKSFHMPFAVVDNKIDVDGVDFILGDNMNGTFKLVDHRMKIHGYRKNARISRPRNAFSGFDKLINQDRLAKNFRLGKS